MEADGTVKESEKSVRSVDDVAAEPSSLFDKAKSRHLQLPRVKRRGFSHGPEGMSTKHGTLL
jgi:hypothetical protein